MGRRGLRDHGGHLADDPLSRPCRSLIDGREPLVEEIVAGCPVPQKSARTFLLSYVGPTMAA